MDIACKEIEECTGCGACVAVCPYGAIDMVADSEGFLVPYIDSTKCIQCGLCSKVCPVNGIVPPKFERECYVARTKDERLLDICTSGGVFTEIARQFIMHGGVAYGAVIDKDFKVVHKRISELNEIDMLAGSKYVQSDFSAIFHQVRDDLDVGLEVVVCGTPCQIAGLKKYLNKEYDKLCLVDLVCHGVPSPFLWKQYIEYGVQKNGSIRSYNFRKKTYGYHVTTMEALYDNGRLIHNSGRTDYLLKSYFSNVANRECCYSCHFKTYERCSDLTLFDSWHAGDLTKEVRDDDKGFTNIIVQSNRGQEVLASLKDCVNCYSCDGEEAARLDGKNIYNCYARPSKRDIFYTLLKEEGFERAMKVILPISGKDRFIEKTKHLLYSMGIIRFVKRMKG